jgi:TRAP transporter TAXI family solute receptor
MMARRHHLGLGALALLIGLAGAFGARAQDAALPDTMVWSTYDVGSTGYNEASAIADALMKEHGVRIRLLPAGTSIGRISPLQAERASYGWLATETFFATEAIYEYAALDQGPQDLRILLGRPAFFGIVVTKESGIGTLEDLKGRQLAWVPANSSVNVKLEAMLSFAGLTVDDMERVTLPSYAASLRALVDGTAEAAGTSPTAATLRELEASPRGIGWVPVPPDDEEGWQRLREVAPFFAPAQATIGAGMSKDKPVDLLSYKYPMITTYASTSADEVYALTKAIGEAFDLFKGSGPVMALWDPAQSGVPPADAPFHEGAIRYLKEVGVWTAEHDAWNEARLERLQKVQSVWDETVSAAEEQGLAGEEFTAFWLQRRQEALAQ